MVFSTATFLFLFLPFTLAMYYVIRLTKLPTIVLNVFLLLMSLLFYAWGGFSYLFIMLASIVVNYLSGLMIGITRSKKVVVVLAIIANLGLLFYFKYFDFAISSVNQAFGASIPLKNIVLPIGISFYTFQGMSYVIDVYRNDAPVQKNPLNVALYISLFPQLIAGPIVRYKDVNEQIMVRSVDLEKFTVGVQRFTIGLAKKALIANQMGFVTDQIFANPPHTIFASTAWVGIICYMFQIYFDFSGYSDMAIGLGKMFGFDFLENFNFPYISKSMTEFWRRWHISLSTWFRDYLYIPMGGNRRGNVYLHLFIVFCATGLWHGASWNFLVWGLWNGLFLIIERLLRKKKGESRMPAAVGWLYAMLVVIIGWVLFRSDTLAHAMEYLGVMFGLVKSEAVGFTTGWYVNNKTILVMLAAAVASIPWKTVFPKFFQHRQWKAAQNVLCICLFLLSCMEVLTSSYNPFIYFRF